VANNNISIGTLKMDDKGNRICIVEGTPMCARCGSILKKGSTVYLCSLSKKIYCYECKHSKTFWACDNMFNVSEHIDWFSTLEIKTK